MSSFKFEGFTIGSQVSLSAMQGGNSASRTVSTWGQGSMGSIDILQVQSDNLIAPAVVWFEAINVAGFAVTGPGPGEVYDPSFHEITYIWDFGDAGGFSEDLNIPDAWNDRNTAYGKRAAHVFRDPGTYQVSLWAIDRNGVSGQASVSITIENPETAYSGSRTICFDASGDFTGAPAGAQQFTDMTGLTTAIGNLTQAGRILFRRGSDQEVGIAIDGEYFNQNLLFGTFGSGARPILRPPFAGAFFTTGQNARFKHIVFESLDIRGRWDPTREVGSTQDKAFEVLLRNVSEMTTLVHDCRLSGLSSIDISTLKPLPYTSVVSDSLIEDWCLYGFYANRQIDGVNDNSRIAFIGAAIQQNAHACKGADTGGFHGIQNQNGPIRYETARKFLMRSCYLFSNNSWALGAQPPIRMMTDNDGGCSAIFDRVTFEGGSEILGADGTPRNPGNFLFDRILLVGTADTNSFGKLGAGGTTLRNALMWQPNIPHLGFGGGPVELLDSTAAGSSAENLDTPVALHNITILDELPGPNRVFSDLALDFNAYTEENNIYHAPNRATPVTGDAPLDISTTIAGFTPRYAGRRNSISRPQTITQSDTAVNATIAFSYPMDQDGTTPLSAGDFNPNGNHLMRNLSTGAYHYVAQSDIAISFGATVVVSNTSGAPMSAGDYRLALEYNGFVTDAQHALPSAVPLVRPVSGSSAYQSAAGVFIGLDDFLLQRRPEVQAVNPGPGNPSQGGVEPG